MQYLHSRARQLLPTTSNGLLQRGRTSWQREPADLPCPTQRQPPRKPTRSASSYETCVKTASLAAFERQQNLSKAANEGPRHAGKSWRLDKVDCCAMNRVIGSNTPPNLCRTLQVAPSPRCESSVCFVVALTLSPELRLADPARAWRAGSGEQKQFDLGSIWHPHGG
jgi:hypothetical protein